MPRPSDLLEDKTHPWAWINTAIGSAPVEHRFGFVRGFNELALLPTAEFRKSNLAVKNLGERELSHI
jgi:hypothetical protein